MIDQTTFYDPENPGSGNCTEACIASLLGITLDEVGKFRPANDDFWADFYAFFAARGLEVGHFKGSFTPDCLHMASGPAGRGCDHMVLRRGGDIVHDPHPSRAGLIEVKNVWLVNPLDLREWKRQV